MLNLDPSNVIFDPLRRAIGVRAKGIAPFIWLAIEVEDDGRCFDFKLYQEVVEGQSSLWLDAMSHTSAGVSRRSTEQKAIKVEFRNYSDFFQGRGESGAFRQVLSNQLWVRREIKIDDVHLPFMPSDMTFFTYAGQWAERSLSVDAITRKHGWKGMMSWRDCQRCLSKVWINQATEEIYFALMDRPRTYLVVDFDNDNVDMKVNILVDHEDDPLPSTSFQWNLEGSSCKVKGRLYHIPKKVRLGHLDNGRITEEKDVLLKMSIQLDDVPFGTLFKEMQVFPVDLNLQSAQEVSAADAFPHLLKIVRGLSSSHPSLPSSPPLSDLPIFHSSPKDS